VVSKCLDFRLGQGEIRFENGAYTLVREYFETDRNTALGQEMTVFITVLVDLAKAMKSPRRHIPMPDDVLPAQVPALLITRRAINDPKLLGSIQGADLLDIVVVFDQPSFSGKVKIKASLLAGREDHHIKIRGENFFTGIVRKRPAFFRPGNRFQGKRAILRQIHNRQRFIGRIGQSELKGGTEGSRSTF